jgi:CheY-like chemotaxis protein
LIIEDNPSDIFLLTKALAAHEIADVTAVHTIDEATQFLEGKYPFSDREKYPLPKVLFIDMALPDGDARTKLAEWRAILGKQSLFVLMTGSQRVDDLQALYNQGADTFLGKQISEDDLKNLKSFYKDYFIGLS